MQEAPPAVSVVIPTYNRRSLVLEALASVSAQTLDDHEVLVVDDGSSDGTAEAIQATHGEDPRVRVLCKANGGTASARNHGIAAVRAPRVALLDSDDRWLPTYLASQCAALEQSGADMVLCDATYENQPGRDADHMFADPHFKPPLGLEDMLAGAWGLPSASVFRTEVLRALGYRATYGIVEDTEMLFRFHEAGYRCVLNEDRLAVWRRAEGQDAPSKTTFELETEVETLRLLDQYMHLASDARAARRALYVRHRQVAKALVRQGRWREARPHLRAWWLARPGRLSVLARYLWSHRRSAP